MLDKGLAVGLEQLEQLKPPPGDQAYKLAPEAVSKTELPEQIVALAGVTFITGAGETITSKEVVSEHMPFDTITL